MVRPILAALLALCLTPERSFADEARPTLIVLAKRGATAHFVDVASGEVRLSLPTGEGPHEVAVRADGKQAVVSDYGAATPGDSLTVLDLVDREVTRTITLEGFARPHGVAYLPGGERVVVTAEQNRSLLVVDVASGEIVKRIPTQARGSHMVSVTPRGDSAWVANIASGTASLIDLETGLFDREVRTGRGCEGIDITPDGAFVWTTNREADTISVIARVAKRVGFEIETGDFPIRVRITPDGSEAWVTCAEGSEVRVYSVASREELAVIPIHADLADDAGARMFGESMEQSPLPIGLLISPDGRTAFVAAANADAVVTIDVATKRVTGVIEVGPEPDGLGFAMMSWPTADDEG